MDNTEIDECTMAAYYWQEKNKTLNIISKLRQQKPQNSDKYLKEYNSKYAFLNDQWQKNYDICRLFKEGQ